MRLHINIHCSANFGIFLFILTELSKEKFQFVISSHMNNALKPAELAMYKMPAKYTIEKAESKL
ncbi:hypothetical protein T10_12626 [Trichinella papuae]|uniref:Uncharacterized protein n=1 Tax=Trichinella papuae TaxID=268474 RepID=A0A0V1MMN4_9BILA|nr:hypothetical protein T10_12626 [Trichinella papuae]